MDKTCSYDICTGCGVCSTVCPKDCISFITGDFGHIFPKIDTSVCIDCKKCERACPALKNNLKQYPHKCYAALIKNPDDYKTTTSGGAAQALSLFTLGKGGVVYGCASLPGGKIQHIRVDNCDDLDLLKGSKYVQSSAWVIYDELIDDVKTGKRTLFIGTPCQCAAVKALFKEQPDNLLIVDLICHGVPSQKFLLDYLKANNVDLQDVSRLRFRTEKGYQIIVLNHNLKPFFSSIPLFTGYIEDLYYGLFFNGYSSRKSCYTCQFASPERCSDITIGDFWGLGKKEPCNEIPEHKKGISVILSNTVKGEETVKEFGNLINLYPRPVTEAIAGNDQLRHPKVLNYRIRCFNYLRNIIGIRMAFRITTIDKVIKRFIKKFILHR